MKRDAFDAAAGAVERAKATAERVRADSQVRAREDELQERARRERSDYHKARQSGDYPARPRRASG
jgi:hypothetical protein